MEASFPTTDDDKFVFGNIFGTIGDEEEIGFFFSIKLNTFWSWDFVKVHSGTFELTFAACDSCWELDFCFTGSMCGKICRCFCWCCVVVVAAIEVVKVYCEWMVQIGLMELMEYVVETDCVEHVPALVISIGTAWFDGRYRSKEDGLWLEPFESFGLKWVVTAKK